MAATLNDLTEREREVSLALGRGERPRDIANRLGLDKNTVHCYQRRARDKFGLYSRQQLARFVRERGWV